MKIRMPAALQSPNPAVTRRLGVVAALMVSVGMALVFLVAPRAQDAAGGDAQRIFYFHVSSAWIGFAAMGVCAFASWRYLITRDMGWDRFALANAEISVLFLALMLLSGMLWGRPTWNVWWTWQEPKLVVSALQFLLYVSYLVLRSAVDDPHRRARLGAVFGLLIVILVPFNFLISRVIADGVHPVVFGPSVASETQAKVGIAALMVPVLLISLAAFSVLYVYLVRARTAIQERLDRIEARKAALS